MQVALRFLQGRQRVAGRLQTVVAAHERLLRFAEVRCQFLALRLQVLEFGYQALHFMRVRSI